MKLTKGYLKKVIKEELQEMDRDPHRDGQAKTDVNMPPNDWSPKSLQDNLKEAIYSCNQAIKDKDSPQAVERSMERALIFLDEVAKELNPGPGRETPLPQNR